jgi:hypothetical protein
MSHLEDRLLFSSIEPSIRLMKLAVKADTWRSHDTAPPVLSTTTRFMKHEEL